MAEPAIDKENQEERAVSGSAIARRYAVAFLDLAREQGELEQIEADMANLVNMLEKSEALKALVTSPVYAQHIQSSAMMAVIAQAKLSPLIGNLVQILIQNSRLSLLEVVVRAFKNLVVERRGEVRVEAISARPLSPAQLEALETALAQRADGTVILNARTDKNLLGGLIVKIGSRMVDDSLRNKLTRLKLKMKEA